MRFVAISNPPHPDLEPSPLLVCRGSGSKIGWPILRSNNKLLGILENPSMISQLDSRDPYRHPTKNRDNHLLKISIFKSCMSLLENSESLSPNSVMSRSDFWLSCSFGGQAFSIVWGIAIFDGLTTKPLAREAVRWYVGEMSYFNSHIPEILGQGPGAITQPPQNKWLERCFLAILQRQASHHLHEQRCTHLPWYICFPGWIEFFRCSVGVDMFWPCSTNGFQPSHTIHV